MKYFAIFGFVASTCFAGSSPFEGVTGKSLILGVDDCSATKLLDKAITESGVNPLDRTPSSVWTCKCVNGRGACEGGGTDESRYQLNGCKTGEEITCYSNSPSKSPAICIEGPRSVKLNKHYGDAGNVVDIRARFKKIIVLRTSGAGYSNNKSWTMDAVGCDPTNAYDNNPVEDADECKKYISAYLNGGYLYSPDISKKRFCDGGNSQDHINAISKLNTCIEAYPQLGYGSAFDAKGSSAPKTNSAVKGN